MKKVIKLLSLLSLITVFNSYGSEFMVRSAHKTLPDHLEKIKGLEKLRFVLNKRSVSATDQESLIYWVLSQKSSDKLKGLLLYGPPGTGKTTLVTALKEFFNVDTLIELSPSDIQTPEQVQKQFENVRKIAETKFVMLFLDEVDDIAKEGSLVLNQLLIETARDNKNMMIIASTNYREKLAPAFLRPGRFDVHILIPQAQGPSRSMFLIEALEKHLAEDKVALNPEQIIQIIKSTKGFSPADMRAMVRYANTIATTHNRSELNFEDFNLAILILKKNKANISSKL